jgi:hypothetical protein
MFACEQFEQDVVHALWPTLDFGTGLFCSACEVKIIMVTVRNQRLLYQMKVLASVVN